MKKKLQYLLTLTVLMAVVITFTGCGSSKRSDIESSNESKAEESWKEEPKIDDTGTDEMPSGIEQGGRNLPNQEQFIIRTGLSVETTDFDNSVKKIEKMATELKGYIESVNANYGTTYDRNRIRNVHYMLRIPKGTTTEAINTVKTQIGLVVDESMRTENVTKQIRDIKRDIELLKAKEDRLIELTKKTEDIEALIVIETELAEIITRREQLQAELQNVEYDVRYDYLSIDLVEVREVTKVEENTFWGDVKTAFRDSIYGLKTFFRVLVLMIVRSWFAIAIMILITLFIILKVKKDAKKSKQRGLDNQAINRDYPNQSNNQPYSNNNQNSPENGNK